MIDFRSDTVTKPSAGMLNAMMQAKVGDDVFGEDPTVNELEDKSAKMFEMEAALFCPSGTMTNQIAIKCNTQPGDEVICDKLSHVYQYEGGGIAFNSGCSVHLIDGDRGRITAAQVEKGINNRNDLHKANSSLVCVENTANRGGGSCYDLDELVAIKKVCKENNIAFHLDGARLFNAIVSKNEKPAAYGHLFDSISICLSKGLGTPVGSVLLGNKNFIAKARRIRKVLGGGMRQAGIIAAAGIYALDENVQRLAEDHKHAQMLANCLSGKDFIGEILPIETNIIIFEVKGKFTPASFSEELRKNNIMVFPISQSQVRMVTHLDVTTEMVQQTLKVIEEM